MAKLNDADADAFFRQGDEGTYSGGPGDSIPAGVVNLFDDLEEDTLPRLTRDQLERRDRYKRWVTGLVGALGVSVAFAGGLRMVATRTADAPKMDSVSAAQIDIVAPPPVAPPAAAPPAAPTPAVVEPEPVAAQTPAASPPPDVPAPPPPVVESVTAPPTGKPAQAAHGAATRAKSSSADREATRAHLPKATVVPTPVTPQVVPSLVHSSPPTANFPD